jgi:hypothetical protein
MAYEYTVRDPFHMPDGRMVSRGDILSASDVAALSNEDHEHKLQRHCIRTVAEAPAAPEVVRSRRAESQG